MAESSADTREKLVENGLKNPPTMDSLQMPTEANHDTLKRARSLPFDKTAPMRNRSCSSLSPLRQAKDPEQPARGSLRTLHKPRDEDTEEEDEFPPLHEFRPRSFTCPDTHLARARARKRRVELQRPPSPPLPNRSPRLSWSREHLAAELPRLQEDTYM